MECGSIDLAGFLRKNRNKMSRGELQGFWRQMLEAVHVVHQQGIIHSDLKPANFLLVEARLKLIDFGIARTLQVSTATSFRLRWRKTPSRDEWFFPIEKQKTTTVCMSWFSFNPWWKFYFPLLLVMVMYDNEFKWKGNKIETNHKSKPQHTYVKRQVAVEVTQTFTRSASLNRNKGLEPIFLLVETVDQPRRANI